MRSNTLSTIHFICETYVIMSDNRHEHFCVAADYDGSLFWAVLLILPNISVIVPLSISSTWSDGAMMNNLTSIMDRPSVTNRFRDGFRILASHNLRDANPVYSYRNSTSSTELPLSVKPLHVKVVIVMSA